MAVRDDGEIERFAPTRPKAASQAACGRAPAQRDGESPVVPPIRMLSMHSSLRRQGGPLKLAGRVGYSSSLSE
jgi:hypothetical protein